MANEPDCDDPIHDFPMLCAADYPAEQVEWLWPGRIPIGKVTLMVGDPGNGKSLVALDVAARVSRGATWPEEQLNPPPRYSGEATILKHRGEGDSESGSNHLPPSALPLPPSHPPGSVLILSIEDDLCDTIRPRLDAAGADPSRIFVLPSIVDLRHDLHELRAALSAAPDCRLIIVDSINAYVGPGDSHFHTIVRRVLQPLARLATENKLAVLAISHLRKSDGAAIQRAVGSMGFVAAARAVWTICKDQSQTGRYLLLPLKNNCAADTAGLAYRIKVPTMADHAAANLTPAIVWQVEPVKTTADEAQFSDKSLRGPEALELRAASEWLQSALAHGPQPAIAIQSDGHLADFNERTLRRALTLLGGSTYKESYLGGWIWSLAPQEPPGTNEGDTRKNLSPSKKPVPFEENATETCPLRENPDDFDVYDPFLPDGRPMAEVRPLGKMSKFATESRRA